MNADINTTPTDGPTTERLRQLREDGLTSSRGISRGELIAIIDAELARREAQPSDAQMATEIDRLRTEVARLHKNRRHTWWGAGEPDCPRDIKASNGELHTLRCKTCGGSDPDKPCSVTDEEVDDYALIMMQGALLQRAVNVIRGEPEPLHQHGSHDLPELVAELKAERDALRAALSQREQPAQEAVPFGWYYGFNDPDPQCDVEFGPECPEGWKRHIPTGKVFALYTAPPAADLREFRELARRMEGAAPQVDYWRRVLVELIARAEGERK